MKLVGGRVKVKELIDTLKTFDQELEVYSVGWDDSAGPAEYVKFVHYDGYNISILDIASQSEKINGVTIE